MPIPHRYAAGDLIGWHPDPPFRDALVADSTHPVWEFDCTHLRASGSGKTVLLYEAIRRVTGGDLIHRQTIGDCVSHGWGLAVDTLQCVEIALGGERELWTAEVATEPLYACSRVEVAGGRLRGDGSNGSWAAKAVRDHGTLHRLRYEAGPGFDLTTYSGSLARQWGAPRRGVPDDLEPVQREHPVETCTLVTNYESARDAIANGYPVPACSNQGFSSTRDSEGFAAPRGSWAHCMLFFGVDDSPSRPGLLCMNSWGKTWNKGPKGRFEIPDGSFWVEAAVATRMLRQDDSFAISGYRGFPARRVDYALG